jgi:putative membrane protein
MPSLAGEPTVLVAVLATGGLYLHGLRRLWARAGRERGVKSWQAALFLIGLLAVLLALDSPLESLSAQAFAAHMLQHLLLILVCGPLLVLGAPLLPFLWALPRPGRLALGRGSRVLTTLARPPLAFVLHSLALWLWHVPPLYEAAVADINVHVAEHLSFVLTAGLFWWAVLHRIRDGHAASVLYLFGMAVQSTILGALLTFAQAPWYRSHLSSVGALGLTPSEDQQLAGLIMWVPGGSVYLAAALGLFAAWLSSGEQSAHTPDPAAHTPARQ